MSWSQAIITGRYDEDHLGVDARWPDCKVPIFGDPIKLIFSGKTYGYDVHGNKLPDWAVIYETKDEYWWFFHLTPFFLPKSLEEMKKRGWVGLHVLRHPSWGTHCHVGRAKKKGPWVSVTHAEENGWTVDPLEGGDEMIERKYLEGRVFQYKGEPTVYWEVPDPEAFGKYIGDWGLLETREKPFSKTIEDHVREIAKKL